MFLSLDNHCPPPKSKSSRFSLNNLLDSIIFKRKPLGELGEEILESFGDGGLVEAWTEMDGLDGLSGRTDWTDEKGTSP